MLLANGMTLEIWEHETHVDIVSCEEYDPSTFGGSYDCIRIPRENWEEFKELLRD